MYDKHRRFRPITYLSHAIVIIVSIVILTSLLLTTVYAQQAGRNTDSWTNGDLTISFSVPNTYESCTNTSDRIFTEGIPADYSLKGDIYLYWAVPTGEGFELIRSYPISQKGNLDLTIDYPPSSTWPDLTSIGNPLRELHVSPAIEVRNPSGDAVSWLGNDTGGAPGNLGPGQVWDVICLPTGNPPTPTNTPTGPTPTNTPVGPTPTNTPSGGTAALGDHVWSDTNGNGVQDGGEPGVPGVTVELLANCAGNTVLATKHTNVNGDYIFNNLAAGQYRVRFTLPSGFSSFSPKKAIADDDYDSDANSDGVTDCITLNNGEQNYRVDAGLLKGGPTPTPTNTPVPTLGSIGDRVWLDNNSNGIQDAGEPGVANILVQLQDCSDNILSSTTTDVNGNYNFPNLNAGCYVVRFRNISVYGISPPNQGGDDTRDSDVTQLDSVTPGIINGQTDPINLTQGENNPTIDAGLTPPTQLGSIGDRVWRDDNSNGIQDAGEPGVPGVTVQLKDCNNNVIRTATTDTNGNYTFGGLTASCYRVGIVPNGFTISPANQGNDDTRDSDVDPNSAMTGNINLAPGENNPTVDAGLIPAPQLGSIGDRVWRDDNSNGIQDANEPGVPGITVQLKDCNNNVIRTTTTDGNGNYNFGDLAASCYRVGIVPNGFTISPANQGSDDTRDSDVDPNSAMTGNINLAPGENNPTVDAGLIPAPQLTCGLTVDQKCSVPVPPPSSNFSCSDAKPLNELSMRWNGSQTVDVKAWKGNVGSTLLATVTNVSPNQIVTVTGYAGAPNDVIWEIFVAGTNNKLGESTFHLSCSDSEMDGPEDCGAAEGNGKKNESSFLNSWRLEGLAGNGVRLACTSTPPPPTDSCTLIAGGGSVCNGQKPTSLTFRYTGGSCNDTTNPQEGKVECSGNPGNGIVSIRVLKDANKISVSPSSVGVGGEFTVSSSEGKELKSELQLAIGGQTLTIHTSCSKSLNLGDVFGSLELVGADGQRLDTTVTFSFLVANSGDALSNVSVEDSFGPVAGPFNLATGDSRIFERKTTIAKTMTNLGFVRGFLADGQLCSDEDRTTITVEPPALSCDDGKPIALVFEYTGGSCSDTTNPQEGKLQCSGNPGSGAVSVSMQKDAAKISVRPSTVNPGERFTIARTDGKKLSSETVMQVGGQSLNIHTSCSKAINVGDVFGSLRLVQFVPEGFPIPTAAGDGNAEQSIFLPMITR